MLSIKENLIQIINSDPILAMYWHNKLLNHKALAAKLKPLIQAKILKNISLGSLQVSLSRIEDKQIRSYKPIIKFQEVVFNSEMEYFAWKRSPQLVSKVQNYKDRILHEAGQNIFYLMDPAQIVLGCPSKFYDSQLEVFSSDLISRECQVNLLNINNSKPIDMGVIQYLYNQAFNYKVKILCFLQYTSNSCKLVYKSQSLVDLQKFQESILHPVSWL